MFTSTPAFSSLKQSFKGDLILPDEQGYDEAIQRWSANAVKRAGLIAFVKTPEDVSSVIKFAVNEKVAIVVRGEPTPVSRVSKVVALMGSYRRRSQFIRIQLDRRWDRH